MFLFRAMNNIDMDYYDYKKNINCSLLNAYNDIGNKSEVDQEKIREYYYKYFEDIREYALNGMIGHVSGAKFKCGRSPWISTSSDFNFVACEYAVPQAGNYNWLNERKPIILIDYDDDKIYENVAKIFELKKSYIDDFAINLENNKLQQLYDFYIIENELTTGYTRLSNGDIVKNKLRSMNNFASQACEVLIYKEIKYEYIKLVIYPLLQDVIYSCDVNMNKGYYIITKNKKKINKICEDMIKSDKEFARFYPSVYLGTPLTDILYEKYYEIPGENIESKYQYLKELKKNKLNLLIQKLNNKLNTEWEINKLVDDKIIVCSDYKKYSKRQLNDIVLIERDNNVYRYSHQDKSYVSKNNVKIKIKK